MIDPLQFNEMLSNLLKNQKGFNPDLLNTQGGDLLTKLKFARDQLDVLIRFIETKDPRLLRKIKSMGDFKL